MVLRVHKQHLFKITPEHGNHWRKFFRVHCVVELQVGTQMPFQYFQDQAVHRAAHRRKLLQHGATFGIFA